MELLKISRSLGAELPGFADGKGPGVKFRGFVETLSRLLEFLKRRIELLGLDLRPGGGDDLLPPAMNARADVEKRTGLQSGMFFGSSQHILIEFHRVFTAPDLPLAGKIVKRLGRLRQFFLLPDGGNAVPVRGGDTVCRRSGIFGCAADKKNGEQKKDKMSFHRPLGNDQIEKQHACGRDQSQRELFDGNGPDAGGLLRGGERFDPALQRGKAGIGDGAADIHAARGFGRTDEFGLRKFGDDEFARLITAEPAVAVRHGRARLRIAETDDEQRRIAGLEIGKDPGAVAFEFVAVGKQHDGPVGTAGGLEGFGRGPERLFEICPAHGNEIGRKFVDVLLESNGIRSQRTHSVGRSGKGDQTETILRIAFDQLPQNVFGVGQTRRCDVSRQHAFGNVEKHHDVPSGLGIGHHAARPVRPGRRRCEQQQHDKKQKDPEPPEALREDHGIGIVRGAAEKQFELFFFPFSRPPRQNDDQHGDGDHPPEILWIVEIHDQSLLIFRNCLPAGNRIPEPFPLRETIYSVSGKNQVSIQTEESVDASSGTVLYSYLSASMGSSFEAFHAG